MRSPDHFDVAVIGGGAAGMLAAGMASQPRRRVLLIEKNTTLGKKLSITGKGRCNLTTSEPDIKLAVSRYGRNGRFINHCLGRFSNKDVVTFFENLGLSVKTERGQRIFPVSDSAHDVVRCLEGFLKKQRVIIKSGNPVVRLIAKKHSARESTIDKIVMRDKAEISANHVILATGGSSYPGTGSSGDAYAWLKKLGHKVISPKPGLAPVIVSEPFVRELDGLHLHNVEVSLWNRRKIESLFGEAQFTPSGLDGPTILNLTKAIHQHGPKGLRIRIDLKPALDYPSLDRRVLRDFGDNGDSQFKNCLGDLLPAQMIPVVIKQSKIPPSKKVTEITKTERKRLTRLLKEFEVTVKRLDGFERSIVTLGGVDLKEVDPKTMRSRIVSNLYFAGEILDIDGPTGGYNLQVAWSTGHLAGETCASMISGDSNSG